MLPVLSGHEDPPNPNPDDETEEEEEDDETEDDDDDDDEDEATKGIKDPKVKSKIKELSDEAAKHRVSRNKARTERDEARTKLAEVTKELEDLKKSGGTDETLKTRNTELETEVAKLKKDLDDANKSIRSSGVERQVSKAVEDLKIDATPKYVIWLLGEEDMLDVDEDGDVEDLQRNLKKLIKSKSLKIVSDDDGDDSDDDDDATSGARQSSSKSFNSKRKGNAALDRKTLEEKYPALRR